MMDKTCAVCGAPNACWGLRRPGPWSRLPPRWKGYRWACSQHCLSVLEARLAAALGERPPAAPRPKAAQGALL